MPIWDLSGLNLTQIPLGDVRQLPGELRKYMDRRGDHYKAAIVVGSGVRLPVAETLRDHSQADWHKYEIKASSFPSKMSYQWIGGVM